MYTVLPDSELRSTPEVTRDHVASAEESRDKSKCSGSAGSWQWYLPQDCGRVVGGGVCGVNKVLKIHIAGHRAVYMP